MQSFIYKTVFEDFRLGLGTSLLYAMTKNVLINIQVQKNSKIRMLQRKYFPMVYKKWLFEYSERNLIFTLHTLPSEQNRETAVVGIEHLLHI